MLVNVITIEEFIRTHGGPPVATADSQTFVLPSGAHFRRTGYGDEFFEPSTDALELLTAKKTYHQGRMNIAADGFARLKNALLGGGTYRWEPAEFGPPLPDEKEALLKLRDLVLGHQDALAQIQAAIDAHPVSIAARKKAEHAAQQKQVMQEAQWMRRQMIEQITI